MGTAAGDSSAAAAPSPVVGSSAGGDRAWQQLESLFDWEPIRQLVDPLLDTYTARTSGSAIRYLTNSISWNFNSSDPEWGMIQAKQLKVDAEEVLCDADIDMEIVLKKGFLETVPAKLKRLDKFFTAEYAAGPNITIADFQVRRARNRGPPRGPPARRSSF